MTCGLQYRPLFFSQILISSGCITCARGKLRPRSACRPRRAWPLLMPPLCPSSCRRTKGRCVRTRRPCAAPPTAATRPPGWSPAAPRRAPACRPSCRHSTWGQRAAAHPAPRQRARRRGSGIGRRAPGRCTTAVKTTTLATLGMRRVGGAVAMRGPVAEITTFTVKAAKPGGSRGGHGPTVTARHLRTTPPWSRVYCLWQKAPVRKERGLKPATGGGSKWSGRRDYHVRTINKSEVDRGKGAGADAAEEEEEEELNVGRVSKDGFFLGSSCEAPNGFYIWIMTAYMLTRGLLVAWESARMPVMYIHVWQDALI